MKRSIQLACVMMSVGFLGLTTATHADEPASPGRQYRQEVLDRLQGLQSSLDQLYANHQLTLDQYQAESGKIKQLVIQTRVDAKEQDTMTKEERATKFDLIQQISQETSQFSVATRAATPSPVANSTGTSVGNRPAAGTPVTTSTGTSVSNSTGSIKNP